MVTGTGFCSLFPRSFHEQAPACATNTVIIDANGLPVYRFLAVGGAMGGGVKLLEWPVCRTTAPSDESEP